MSEYTLKDNAIIDVVDEVVRLQGRFKSLFGEVHRDTELTRLQSLVLTSVLEASTEPTVSRIGRSLGYPRQIVQRAATELLEAGYLKKSANPHHKRSSLLVGTPKAHSLKRSTDKAALAIAQKFLETGDERRCRRLANALREVRREIEVFIKAETPAAFDAAPQISAAGALIQLEKAQ